MKHIVCSLLTVAAVSAAAQFCVVSAAHAQERLYSSSPDDYKSPEVSHNGTVTFRLQAPEARSVKVMGNWMNGQTADMQKDDKGLWSYTSVALKSDMYYYSFVVDGVVVADPHNINMLRDIAYVSNTFIVDVDRNGERLGNGELYKVQNMPHGTVSKVWYDSPTLGTNRRLTVYTPAGYEASGKKKYPVLYLLHGVGGDEEAWMTSGRASQILDNLIGLGRAKPMIVVMPNGHTSNTAAPGESSRGLYRPAMYTPDVCSGDMERSFNDIVNFIEKTYRVKADSRHRALAGLSMGGLHTAFISMGNPGEFGYVGLFSPATKAFHANGKGADVYANAAQKLAAQKQAGYRLYWIGIGKDDFLYKDLEEFRHTMDSLDMEYEYKESDGGHTWNNWRNYLVEFLPKLFR